MDALDEKAFNELMLKEEDDDEEVPFEKLKEQALIRATAIFEEKYFGRLHGVKHKPRCVVQLRSTLPLVRDTSNPLIHSSLRHGQGRYLLR